MYKWTPAVNHRATTSDHENYPCELRQAYPTKEQTIKYYQPINEDVSLELNAEVKEAQIPRITAETTCGHVNAIYLFRSSNSTKKRDHA